MKIVDDLTATVITCEIQLNDKSSNIFNILSGRSGSSPTILNFLIQRHCMCHHITKYN